MKTRKLKHQKTKTVGCKINGRSSDIVSANFILGCNAKCRYCYEKRWDRDKIYINENYEQILKSCENWAQEQQWPKIPNQCDPKYYIVDIGCNTDINYHWKDYDWTIIFDWFKDHPKLKASFATKFVNNKLLEYNAENKIRIRYSLMPQTMSYILEPDTTPIHIRINAIDRFIEAGYEVHLNISPVVIYDGWKEDYKQLFDMISQVRYAHKLKFEVIFLTHNQQLHDNNIELYPEAEKLLWKPEIQESKNSIYGGNNVRYQWQLKNQLIEEFKQMFSQFFNSNQIRYIF